MRKIKFILPAVAIIFTIALSYATITGVDNYAPYYIQLPNECKSVDAPCDNVGMHPCQVFSLSLGGPYQVYERPEQGNETLCTQEVTDSSPTVKIIP